MISGFVLLALAFVCIVIHYAYVLPKRDRVLFRMYRNRDKLALVAMEDEKLQETKQYLYLNTLINGSISMFEVNVSITDFYNMIKKRGNNTDSINDSVISQIKSDDRLLEIYEEARELYCKYFCINVGMGFNFFIISYVLLEDIIRNGNAKPKKVGKIIDSSTFLDIPVQYEQSCRMNI